MQWGVVEEPSYFLLLSIFVGLALEYLKGVKVTVRKKGARSPWDNCYRLSLLGSGSEDSMEAGVTNKQCQSFDYRHQQNFCHLRDQSQILFPKKYKTGLDKSDYYECIDNLDDLALVENKD